MIDFYQNKINYLNNNYRELQPIDFYRLMFPIGSFQKCNENNGDYKPNGLLQYRNKTDSKNIMHNVIIYDDLQVLQDCIDRKGRFAEHEFCTVSGCAYIGHNKTNNNSRFCYALIFDIDMVDVSELEHLFYMTGEGLLPIPTTVNVSGNGVHLVYILDKPVPLYHKKAEMLKNLKAILTRKLWNAWTSQDANVQYQGIVQGYRMVGTKTKQGHIAKAFLCGKKVSLDYLITFVDNIEEIAYLKPTKIYKNGSKQSVLTERLKNLKKENELTCRMMDELCISELSYPIEEAKELWPEWYQRRVVDKQKPGHWHLNRQVYVWWLDIIKKEAHIGIRRKCILVLAAYAQKCDVPADEFIKDAYALVPMFEHLTVDDNNHFTNDDVAGVIAKYYEQDLTKMSVKGIERMTGITMHRPKEPKREKHLEKCRQIRDANYGEGEHWYDNGGRPSKENLIVTYIKNHPDAGVTQIANACQCSRPTVYKYLKPA